MLSKKKGGIVKVYEREIDRQRTITRKADDVAQKLLFVTEALRELFRDDHFNTLLRAEELDTLPKQLSELMDEGSRPYV